MKNISSRPASSMNTYIALGLLITTGAILATPVAAGPSVLLALIATVLMLVSGRNSWQELGESTSKVRNLLLIAFGGWFFAEFVSTAINTQHWNNLDYPLRFLLGIGVFWLIRISRIRQIEFYLYSIVLSAFAAIAVGSYQHYFLELDRSMGWTNYPIYYGNLSVLLCLFALIAVLYLRESLSKPLRWMLWLAIPMLVFSAYLSGSRSSWLGMLGLLALVDWRRIDHTRVLGGGVALTIALITILLAVPELSSKLRIAEAMYDVRHIMDADYSTSIGYRLQMWYASMHMFWSSPLAGIGSGNFQAAMADLVATGVIEKGLFEGETNFNQAHSEIMDALATKGMVGLVAYLGLLILPYRFFRQISEAAGTEAKTIAIMGQATIIAFLMFGLTLATFKVQIYCAVFPIIIAVLAALSLNLSEAVQTKKYSDPRVKDA